MKNNKGFSLVELIVVIAIMAILAAVAVVGVSVYIPKAQQANDKQLVSDIQYALNLHYQANPEFEGVEMIIIGLDGTTASGSFSEAVMRDAFGDYESLKLQYDGWGNGASVTAAVLQSFKTETNEDLTNVYNGNSVPTFAEDVDELFVEIRDTSMLVADKAGNLNLDNVNIESGADLLKKAAEYTLADGGEDSSFGDVTKFKNAWTSFTPVVNMAGTGDDNILDNETFTAETFAPAVATAAVVKARNVSIATYLQNKNPAYAKYYDAIANCGGEGIIPKDLAEVVSSSGNDPQLIADKLEIADDEGFDLVLFTQAIADAYGYFEGGESSPAAKDAAAYYAMMNTVNATDNNVNDDEYWNEMAGAVHIYGQIASKKLSLDEVFNAYGNVPEGCIAIMVVAGEDGMEIKVNPAYIVE